MSPCPGDNVCVSMGPHSGDSSATRDSPPKGWEAPTPLVLQMVLSCYTQLGLLIYKHIQRNWKVGFYKERSPRRSPDCTGCLGVLIWEHWGKKICHERVKGWFEYVQVPNNELPSSLVKRQNQETEAFVWNQRSNKHQPTPPAPINFTNVIWADYTFGWRGNGVDNDLVRFM